MSPARRRASGFDMMPIRRARDGVATAFDAPARCCRSACWRFFYFIKIMRWRRRRCRQLSPPPGKHARFAEPILARHELSAVRFTACRSHSPGRLHIFNRLSTPLLYATRRHIERRAGKLRCRLPYAHAPPVAQPSAMSNSRFACHERRYFITGSLMR